MTLNDEKILGSSAYSKQHQICIIREVRPHLELVPGQDRVQFVLQDGKVFLRVMHRIQVPEDDQK